MHAVTESDTTEHADKSLGESTQKWPSGESKHLDSLVVLLVPCLNMKYKKIKVINKQKNKI